MFGFEYKYINSYEIFEKISHITNFGIFEIIFLLIGVPFIFFMAIIFIPNLKLRLLKRKKDEEKMKKKLLIDKIVLQKNLEDVITMELENKTKS